MSLKGSISGEEVGNRAESVGRENGSGPCTIWVRKVKPSEDSS